MKNFTKQQLAQLNKMNRGAFIEIKPCLFDRICYFINSGKSIAPNELKSF